MTPKLQEITMLSRGANLSTRKPLLNSADRAQPTIARSVADAAGAEVERVRQHFAHYDFRYCRQEESGFRDAVGPARRNRGRDEVPSMFKFERNRARGSSDGVCKQVSSAAATGGDSRREERPRDEGPFVFGVHSPSQFQIRSRLSCEGDGSYRYACDGDVTTVINNGSAVNNCDKRLDANIQCDSVRRNGMFRIKDNRYEKNTSAAEEEKLKRERKASRRSNKTKERIKCVLVGDGAVGKTSLITSYAQNKFLEDYEPTAFDNFNVVVEVDGRPVNVELCDTAGQDSLAGLRELCYPGTDVLLLCFSVVKPETFRSITKRWAPAVAKIKAPLILIGTQVDLLDDRRTITDLHAKGDRPVNDYEIKQLASKLKAPYIETSAKQRIKLKDAFDTAILAGLRLSKSKKSIWKKLLCIS